MKIKAIDGLPVTDAKRALNLTITQNDVEKADQKEPHNCAVARAARRELHAEEARVHLSRVYIRTNKGNWTRYLTPKSLRDEIIAFDRGGSFVPSTFTLAPPHKTKKLGKRRGSPKFVRSNKKRKAPHIVTDVRTGPA